MKTKPQKLSQKIFRKIKNKKKHFDKNIFSTIAVMKPA